MEDILVRGREVFHLRQADLVIAFYLAFYVWKFNKLICQNFSEIIPTMAFLDFRKKQPKTKNTETGRTNRSLPK